MGFEFAPITPTEEGDGIIREFSLPEDGVTGSLILGFDPLLLDDHINPVYGLEVHIKKQDRPETPILLTAENRSYLIQGLQSETGSVQYIKLALQMAIDEADPS